MRLHDDQLQRVVRELDIFVARRFGERDACRCRRESTDLRVIEQPLGVRFRATHLTAELGQSRADEDDGQGALRRPMKGGDERGELLFRDVLQLVDEEDERRSCIACCFADHVE